MVNDKKNKDNKNIDEQEVLDQYFDFNKLYDTNENQQEAKELNKSENYIDSLEKKMDKITDTNNFRNSMHNNKVQKNFSEKNVSTIDIFESKQEADKEYQEMPQMSKDEIISLLESALYVVGNEGLSIADLKKLTGLTAVELRKILKNYNEDLEKDPVRGICVKNFGDRYKLFSKACNREKLSNLITVKYRNPLSQKVMETLAIIAYNQPCTKSIIEKIRLKDPTSSIDKLIDLELVCEAGRADTIGRPILYTVTHKFYDIFGIKNVSDLPKINLDQIFQEEDFSFFDTTKFNN